MYVDPGARAVLLFKGFIEEEILYKYEFVTNKNVLTPVY